MHLLPLHVDDTQSVARGQPLLELDPAGAAVAASNAGAKLARAVIKVISLESAAGFLKHDHRLAVVQFDEGWKKFTNSREAP
jgi:multidrug resistance efflux pump